MLQEMSLGSTLWPLLSRAPVLLPTHDSVQFARGRAIAWVTIPPSSSTSSPTSRYEADSRQNEDNPNIATDEHRFTQIKLGRF